MIVLQSRDKEILKLAYEQQFLLTEHLRDHFFHGNYAEAKRRIIELRSAGYLKSGPFKLGKKQTLVLGPLGQEVAASGITFSLKLRPKLDPVTAQHDAIVTSIRLQLQRFWSGNWIPEKAIRGFELREVPDGILVLPNGDKVAIEVENSLKGRTRFENRLQEWSQIRVRLVLFVATTPEIFEALKRFLASAKTKGPAIGLVLEGSLNDADPFVWSPFGELDLSAIGAQQ